MNLTFISYDPVQRHVVKEIRLDYGEQGIPCGFELISFCRRSGCSTWIEIFPEEVDGEMPCSACAEVLYRRARGPK